MNLNDACAFTLNGRMFIVGGSTALNATNLNFEVLIDNMDSYNIVQLQNLNFNFPRGNCISYSDSDALLCSAAVYEGTENFGRECYHFNGENYRVTGYTKYGHNRGVMFTYTNSVSIIGGNGVSSGEKQATSNMFFESFYKFAHDNKVQGGWRNGIHGDFPVQLRKG